MIGERPVFVEQRGNELLVSGAAASQIRHYFALDHPLREICAAFPNDPQMMTARDYCHGLRIIRQPLWECLATFIMFVDETGGAHPADVAARCEDVLVRAEGYTWVTYTLFPTRRGLRA